MVLLVAKGSITMPHIMGIVVMGARKSLKL
nr:MAG TPA: hypothetical protein [Caudoviricetes sp.]